METRRILVTEYTADWADAFLNIKTRLEPALGDMALSIEHVGSTSVVGLVAKPIIDIDIVIRDPSDLTETIQRLGKIGYVYEGNLGIADRDAFRYEGEEHLQTHNLYVCPKNSVELHRHITFRDYLRTHPEAVIEYSEVKKMGAELYPHDIEGYIKYKSACVSELYQKCGLI